MLRRGRLSSIEKGVINFIEGYFKDLLADFDIYKPVYEQLIIKTMMEPTIDTLLCYIMGQVIGTVNLMLDQAGLSVDEKADITESLYREIQVSIVKLREDLERLKYL